MATIRAIAFKSPISMGADGELSSWSEDKHAGKIHIAEKGNFLVFTCSDGRRRRVPMTNIGYIMEDDLPTKAEATAAKIAAAEREALELAKAGE